VKPLIYGYLRAHDLPDDRLDRTIEEMRRFAETEGYCYATTFVENPPNSHAAFDELVHELRRAEAQHVIMPNPQHLPNAPHRFGCSRLQAWMGRASLATTNLYLHHLGTAADRAGSDPSERSGGNGRGIHPQGDYVAVVSSDGRGQRLRWSDGVPTWWS
jgi:hypothetical protein